MSSLRGRLLSIIGGAFVVLWTAVAAWMLLNLRSEVDTALDRRLAASARMVAGLAAQFANGSVSGAAPAGLTDVIARDGLACEVSLMRGELSVRKLARTGAAPAMDQAAPGYGTRTYGGKRWRTYVLQQGGIRVATADRLDVREALWRDVALAAAVPFTVALLGSLLALWVGIGGGLAPLERMRRILATRRPDDDAPLPAMSVPREMRPLVDTIVALLDRVHNALEHERQFTDDAAHELRTPLTGVKTHLQVLQLALAGHPADPAVGEALSDAHESVQRMQRTLEQLLLLARLDADDDASQHETCEASAAAARAVREARAALAGEGDVVMQVCAGCVPLRMPEALLVSALRNLLDNALRFAPAGTSVILRAEPCEEGMLFSVLDEGPGLTVAECAVAARRFWRASPAGSGSGLGLSISARVAARYGGRLALAPRSPHGLCASLTLPRSAGAPSPVANAPTLCGGTSA